MGRPPLGRRAVTGGNHCQPFPLGKIREGGLKLIALRQVSSPRAKRGGDSYPSRFARGGPSPPDFNMPSDGRAVDHRSVSGGHIGTPPRKDKNAFWQPLEGNHSTA
ncbi:hypothetical protein RRG08_015253 [Elysia crispata]|uniref:Uncharacterized protein n=1 Tax=Elysia crispata TaxID=231223 RepID=A0AAE1D7E5_9GAST|nr:hypothetical protein RRG08_015253 [Elysia crispata]